MSKNCSRVSTCATMTVFVEKRFRYLSLMCFSKGLDSIDSQSLTDCKNYETIKKMRRMSSKEPLRSVGMVQAELSSQFVCFLSQYYKYLHFPVSYCH